MKITEVRNLTDKEKDLRLKELKQESLNLRIQQQTGALERPSRLKDIRKTIARIKTVSNQKTIGAEPAKAS